MTQTGNVLRDVEMFYINEHEPTRTGNEVKKRGHICPVNQKKQSEKMETKHHTTGNDGSGNFFLTGAILFANLDASGLAEYAVKAAIGGAIWLVFKFTSDYLSERIKNRKEK